MSLAYVSLLILLALSVGLLMGVIGGGGGGFYVVIMLVFLKLDVRTAISTALVLSTLTLCSASIQYIRTKRIAFDYFITLSISGVIGVLAGSLLISYINEFVLKICILVVFVLSGLSALIKVTNVNNEKIPKATKNLGIIIPSGLFSGVITGALGLSGTTPLSSLLVGLTGLSPNIAIGTTILVTLVTNMMGAIFHIGFQHVDIKILGIFGTGSIIGAVLGSKIAGKINRKLLTIMLAFFAIFSGIFIALHK